MFGNRSTSAAALAVLLLGAACGGSSGLGNEVRQDVTARMQVTQEPIAACYEAALKRNRKLRGTMVLAFTAKAKTGKFEDVTVVRNDLPDPELEQCVVQQVGALALAKPTSSHVALEYPFSFEPLR